MLKNCKSLKSNLKFFTLLVFISYELTVKDTSKRMKPASYIYIHIYQFRQYVILSSKGIKL